MSNQKDLSNSYENTIKTLFSKRGSYSDLTYMPVFRASGIFFAIVDQHTDTLISFMNYWREKNHLAKVGALVTLRDAEGNKLVREFFTVEDFVYKISVRNLLGNSTPFTGSIEVEIFSGEDLKFQFPALMVFYETPKGISFVHTNQRVYNNIEDQQRGEGFNAWQTGFDLHASEGLEPFIFCVNGPNPSEETQVELKLMNHDGDVMNETISLGNLPPYGSTNLKLLSYPGVKNFLGSKVGFCKLNVDLKNVHLRLACGNISSDQSWLSVTHSYFDTTTHHDYYDVKESTGSPCFVPFNLVNGLNVDLIFYPIYSPAILNFSLECFDPEGKQRAWIDLDHKFDSSDTHMYRVDVRDILKSRNIQANEGLYCLHISTKDQKIPTRISYGLNYRNGAKLGCNISTSALMEKSYGISGRAYRWGPISLREGGKNYILASHINKAKDYEGSSDFNLTLYDSAGVVFNEKFTLANATGVNLCAEDLLDKAGYASHNGDILWFVLQSTNPYYECNLIHISRDGYVGGDHAF